MALGRHTCMPDKTACSAAALHMLCIHNSTQHPQQQTQQHAVQFVVCLASTSQNSEDGPTYPLSKLLS